MGCGQSKINLYPRRNKNGGKGNSANKKSGAADKEADEDEGSAAAAATPEPAEEDPDHGKQLLPLTTRPPVLEISESQQDFFKLLDEKIEEGRDYDSTSETEVQIEHERRRILIDQWRSASQSTQSSFSYSSPPTPARRRQPRPAPPDRHSSPGASRRCCRQTHDGFSPPPRRAQSAQSHHQPDPRQLNGDWARDDPNKSPVKRPQSAGSNWKNNPKSNQKTKKETNEYQRTSNAKFEHISTSNQDLTYNTTSQQSPAHSGKVQQPYIAQIVTYPMSQQVTPPSPPKYIAPPEEYQDLHNSVSDPHNNQYTTTQTTITQNQSHIYYIHGNTNVPQDIAQQRQQTAIHLQQYVAMKQAQQQMFTYLQRQPHTVFPGVDQYPQRDPIRLYDHVNEEYIQYSAIRPHSAPAVRQVPVIPGLNPMDSAHAHQMPMWSPMPQIVSSMGPWVPGTQDAPYYPQGNFVQNMYRANSAGSAGTLTRYHKVVDDKNNVCQSINLVRQKPVGQIVVGGQDLTVCSNASDSPSPASVSTDSGVSPGNSVPSSKTSMFSTPSSGSVKEPSLDSKNRKNKAFSRPLKNSKSLDSS